MLIHVGILYCAGVQINIQTFRAEFFRLLVDHCRTSRFPLQGIFHRNMCTSIGFPVVLVLPTLMSAKPVEISGHCVFYGVYALAISHINR